MKLQDVMGKATPGPLAYRARHHSDWGEINSADGEMVVASCNCHIGTMDHDECRRQGIDPVGETAALLAHCYNHFPALLAALKASIDNGREDDPDVWTQVTAVLDAAQEVEI